ncbi:MAG: hypothetical protein GKR89_16040 [Candidatus Latescibacteria bacterium]|nr:hypothetical protein [Candidatus Latescibacterota bacterium]
MSLISDADISQFEELGYFVGEGDFGHDALGAMASEMDRVYAQALEEAEATGDPQQIEAARTRRSFSQFHALSEVGSQFVRQPFYLEACTRLLGPDADLYYNQATTKMPQGRGKVFEWHQDSGYTTTEPLAYITCWTAISDSDQENGCIWVIPESHRWGVLEHQAEAETQDQYGGKNAQQVDDRQAIPVEMRAGQVAVFSSLTLHRSGPNTSADRPRRGFVPQYHVPGAILVSSGEVVGDQVPVLRGGKPVI